MTVQIDISWFEDQVLNPLNNILMLCCENNIYQDVEKEIRRVVAVLGKGHLITKIIQIWGRREGKIKIFFPGMEEMWRNFRTKKQAFKREVKIDRIETNIKKSNGSIWQMFY